MNEVSKQFLVDGLKSCLILNEQINILLDGYVYLVAEYDTYVGNTAFMQRQLSDARTSITELSELLIMIKKQMTMFNDGISLYKHKTFQMNVINEVALHLDMIHGLLEYYQIFPEGYSAKTIVSSLRDITCCVQHFDN